MKNRKKTAAIALIMVLCLLLSSCDLPFGIGGKGNNAAYINNSANTNTENTEKLFDKEQILSPMPNRGSIIPILVNHKKDANMTGVINAAILNGYADIADQVAKSQGVELETSIGDTNRNFINALRYIFYGTLAFALFMYFYSRRKKKQ